MAKTPDDRSSDPWAPLLPPDNPAAQRARCVAWLTSRCRGGVECDCVPVVEMFPTGNQHH
ncbi:hypothetical protein UA75_16220 [Actinoalloteichus sp. GBA129-24]|uniref:Uncharacterized protein n=1 Tax=Actinoalloteichus fjordicus TaxID=1612552 RepID=A0AAC9LC08_9PSEU|nr:hypothetical protein UA74_15655 [Actinoalloteichus fjordicus]APU21252.1 hypothetical protein UA75_16220 [Actinoalloteichus sp. GBA129-24]